MDRHEELIGFHGKHLCTVKKGMFKHSLFYIEKCNLIVCRIEDEEKHVKYAEIGITGYAMFIFGIGTCKGFDKSGLN